MNKVYRKKLTAMDMQQMHVPDRYWKARYAEITEEGKSTTGKTAPRSVAKRFVDNILEFVENGTGLYLHGPNGRGKTCMAVVLLKEARRRGMTGLFVSAASLKRLVVSKTPFSEAETMYERALGVRFLVLDDLGKEVSDNVGFGARVLDELIRHRMGHQMITVITTNMTPDVLKAEADSSKGIVKVSTLHAMKECMIPLELGGPDRRVENARALRKLVEEINGN